MKNKLITLMLMIVLVFSYTIPALASIDYNLNTVNTQMTFDNTVSMTAKSSWYICDSNTSRCKLTYTYIDKDTTFDTQSKCNLTCPKTPTYTSSSFSNINNYYTTTTKAPAYTYTTTPNYYNYVTTTKPSYTYTTTPTYVYNFVTTTTIPNYTYTTNPSIAYYVNTTTTKPVVFFNNQNIKQISNFVTTTKPNYTYITNPNISNFVTTTTIPSYTYTSIPRTINPIATTTTLPLVSGFRPNYDYTFKPTTTTKPVWLVIDQNIIKTIDLKKAVPIITKPIWTTDGINNQNFNLSKVSLLANLQLSINSLKNDLLKLQSKDDEKPLQVITVGTEENKNEGKPIFLIVNQTDGYIKELQTMKPDWDLQFVSSNQFSSPSDLKNYLIKYKSEHNLLKAVLIQKNILEQKVATGNRFNESVISDWYYSHFNNNYDQLPDVTVGRGTPRELYTNLQKPKLSKVSYGQFLPMMTFRRGTKCADGSCAILGKTDPTLWVGKEMSELVRSKGYSSTSLYETEGYQPCEVKPDLSLNTENFMKTIYTTNFIYALSTYEPTYLDEENFTIESHYDVIKRAIWTADKNGNDVMTDDELEVKDVVDPASLSFNYQAVAFLPLSNNYKTKIMKGLSALVYRETTKDTHSWDNIFNMHQSVLATFAEGSTIGDAVYASRVNFAKYTMPDGEEIKAEALMYRLIGDPTLTIEDLYKSSKVDVQPESKNSDKIEIPLDKTEIKFLIKNIGKTEVNYSFDKNNTIEISPLTGVIPVGNETAITLKILNTLPITYQSTDKIQSTPKQKSTKIYFKSNAGDKEITVTYWGV